MMKKLLLSFALSICAGHAFSQSGGAWKQLENSAAQNKQKVREAAYSADQKLYQLDAVAFKQLLSQTVDRSIVNSGVEISFPNVAGQLERFLVWENSNFEPGLQAQFPQIRAYVGKGITDPTAVINFSFAPSGIQTMTLRAGGGSEFIEPFTKDNSVYVLFDSKTRATGKLPFECTTVDDGITNRILNADSQLSNNQSFKTMRLALSCTAEYTTFFGGTVAGALAGMNASMTRVNGVLERDLALHLNIIENNYLVVFTNAATDPYSPAAAGSGGAWNNELQTTLTNIIGEANYDIGHLLGASGGGGNAGCIGCVCGNGKGSGFTSPYDGIPQGDNFDIDYIIHEMGHQLGANHTFSHSTENSSVNVEPGSGSTIMAYAGITGSTDVQAHSDAYFSFASINQIQTNLATKSCPVSVAIANTPPVVNAGADFIIPKSTAFVLKGSAVDAQGDNLTYNWEQSDDAITVGAAASYPSPTKLTGPNFRSVAPNASPNRYMPAFSTVLNNTLSSTWESVSSVARVLNFTLTARDNNASGPQTNFDSNVVTVNAIAGPFVVTSPAVDNETWVANTSKNVTWDVAGTTGNGINTSKVNILFSSDGGATFTTLVANTDNDGLEQITVPNVTSPYNRILVESVGNIFYAVSKNIAIGYTIAVTTTCTPYTATPNAVLSGATSTGFIGYQLVVPDSFIFDDLNVTVNITHPKPSDLRVGIAIPGSGVVNAFLYDRDCPAFSPAQNLVVTFDDEAAANVLCSAIGAGNSYKGNDSLSQFDGMNTQGTWRLAVADATPANNGTLNSFTFTFCKTETVVSLATANYDLAEFTVYPNPNNGNFNVRFADASSESVKILVHDMRGRQIYAKEYAGGGIFNQEIQLNTAQAGIYLLSVTNGDRKEVKRIVVE